LSADVGWRMLSAGFEDLLLMRCLLAVCLAAAAATNIRVSAAAPPVSGPSDAGMSVDSDSGERLWSDSQATLEQELRDSTHPLDWALLANSPDLFETGRTGESDEALLRRAANALPNEVLPQWLFALKSVYGVEGPAATSDIASLTRLDGDNAASWLLALVLASKHGDADGIADALTQMASSSRYDDHFAALLHAWMDVCDRYPSAAQGDDPATKEIARFTAALARAAAAPMPQYQALIKACTPGGGDAMDDDRKAHCIRVGRLMLNDGMTLFARSIGFAVLRHVGGEVPSAADLQQRRAIDWYMYHATVATESSEGEAAAMRAYAQDWRALDDEAEVMKRALRSRGLPIEPPAGWVAPARQ